MDGLIHLNHFVRGGFLPSARAREFEQFTLEELIEYDIYIMQLFTLVVF